MSGLNIGRMLDEGGYTLDEEQFISNHCSIEMCELCGDYVAMHPDYLYAGINNFISLTFEGHFYCQKCK
jgi:hypothetical protein